MPPKNNEEIAKADQARLTKILAGTGDPKLAYKDAYKYAVDSVMDQIHYLTSIKKDSLQSKYIVAAIAGLNLELLNYPPQDPNKPEVFKTPTVQINFVFTFAKGKETVTVKLNHDNPGHDPSKTRTVVFGREMEKKPPQAWDPKHKKEVDHLKKLLEDRWNLYPHFGWELFYKTEPRAGHAYVTFSAMVTDRASRSKNVESDKEIERLPFKIDIKDDISCDGLRYRWKDYPVAKVVIDSQIRDAEKFINGLKVK